MDTGKASLCDSAVYHWLRATGSQDSSQLSILCLYHLLPSVSMESQEWTICIDVWVPQGYLKTSGICF